MGRIAIYYYESKDVGTSNPTPYEVNLGATPTVTPTPTATSIGATAPAEEAGWQASDYSYTAGPAHAVSSIDRPGEVDDAFTYDANGNMTQRVEAGVT